jgi:CDP-paratose 2-epimerase
MKVLITGVCGFVGSSIAQWLRKRDDAIQVLGLDNLSRPGSESNLGKLRSVDVRVLHADIRNASDFELLPAVDWVIDAAATPSVLAGINGITSSRQLVEHNVQGTLNILEYCRKARAGFILLSTSRVYSIGELASLPMKVRNDAFELDTTSGSLPRGTSPRGICTDFPTTAPISLYGSTKVASEVLALEYGSTFSFPVWIDRCGVLAGAGQFGTAEQGIFSFWVHAYAEKQPLKYIGFDGTGRQVRDMFHPYDLAALTYAQMTGSYANNERIFNIGGGHENAMSLAQLTKWCASRFGEHPVEVELTPRTFDIGWLVMDNSRATEVFGWRPERGRDMILDELATHARENRNWLKLTGAI